MVEVDGQLQPTPKPNPGAFKPVSRFQKLLSTNLAKTTRLTPKEFLGFYSGRKLERYTRAVESLDTLPIKEKDAWLSTFVKAEKLNITAKPDPAPRVIQPRDPRYNVEVGRYLRHSEEMLFKAINKTFGGRTIFKGLNSDQAGVEFKQMWDSFRDPVGIGMDASRFDQHISKEALEFEHAMWLSMFSVTERKHLKRLLSWQINNRGIARCPDGEVRYRVEGCRMSGDMNTSSGNCYIMCATVYNWCAFEKKVRHFRLANNGDDCMLVVERKDEQLVRSGLVEYYTQLGFTMKVEPTVDILEKVEFCQTRPVFINGAYRMVRNLHQSLSKDLHSIHDLGSTEAALAWVDAVGDGGRVMNDGVPVMMEFFKRFPKCGRKLKDNSDLAVKLKEDYQYKFSRHQTFQNSTPTPEARFSFWLAFGMLPDEQIALENGFPKLEIGTVLTQLEEETTLLKYSRA